MDFINVNNGISEWYELLGWETLPDMGACHSFAASGDKEEFLNRYLITDSLNILYSNVIEKLKHKRAEQPVVLIKGDPGIGKTTFIYSLIAHYSTNEEINSNYVIYACHANNIQGENWKHEVLYHAKKALKSLYKECGQEEKFDSLCCGQDDGDNGLLQQVRCLKTCISDTEYRKSFPKTLIFVLDNVDSVNESNRVIEAFDLVNQILEPSIIKKWFVVREETLIKKYTTAQRKRLMSFVSDQFVLPSVSLYDIAEKRVQKTTGNGKGKLNPFSKELCDEIVLPICKGNLRDGLSALEAILRNTPPKGFSERKTSEAVLQNYVHKNAIKTLFERGLLINLHLSKYRISALETPFIFDVLNLLQYSTNKQEILALLYSATDLRNSKTGYAITSRERKYSISNKEIEDAFMHLESEELILTNSNGAIQLTQFGTAHIHAASPLYYLGVCKESNHSERTDSYWNIAAVDISYANLARKFKTSEIY